MALDTPSAPDQTAPPPIRPTGRRWAVGIGLAAVVLAGAGATVVARPWASGGPDAAVSAALADRLTADSTAAASVVMTAAGDPSDTGSLPETSVQDAVRAFYDARGGAPAWTAAPARHAVLRLLARADRDGLPSDEALPPDLEALGRRADAEAPDTLLARLDARLTAALLRFGRGLGRPRVDAAALYGSAWTPAPRDRHDLGAQARALAAALSATTDAGAALDAYADGQRPTHSGYRLIRAALARELDLLDAPDLTVRTDLAPSDSGASVRRLRARLAIDGARTGMSAVYDDALAGAVRGYQTRQGLPATGRADGPTRDALNRRQAETIPALALNLERWRWLPDTLGPLHVFVNVPDFELTVREQRGGRWAEVFRSRVVVGQPSWSTPAFSDTMETVVFNPTWMMPASIQRESYGRLRPDRALRQPGPGNALGRVKFLFPNPHAVYIHDTPSKWGFTVDRRALSHGCVRAGDPRGLAVALLSRTNGWSEARIDSIFAGPWTLQEVTLRRPVPVHVAYFTARADAAGRVTLLDDVYGRDPRLAVALGLAPDAPRVASSRAPRRADVG